MPVWAPLRIPDLSPCAFLGSRRAGMGGASGRPPRGVPRPSAGASWTPRAPEWEGARSPPWDPVRLSLKLDSGSLSHLLCALSVWGCRLQVASNTGGERLCAFLWQCLPVRPGADNHLHLSAEYPALPVSPASLSHQEGPEIEKHLLSCFLPSLSPSPLLLSLPPPTR